MKKGSRPLVQFVSKPIAPPFRDGTKCLVRDLVTHLQKVDSAVMGTSAGASELLARTQIMPVYGHAGGFAPGLRQNARAAAWLLLFSRADLWHFVFAPNRRSSQMARALRAARRIPVVQTVASPPRSFANPHQLLFGDVVVAQSEWTRRQFVEAAEAQRPLPPLFVIPPPAPQVPQPTREARLLARQQLGIGETAPLFLYPGDLEVSRGAELVAELVIPLRERLPGAHVVFAYRDKSSRAAIHAEQLRGRLPTSFTHVVPNVPDIHALVAAATAVLFPVLDLYGKVDLPIVLLEAMALGTPVMALDEGPLASLHGAWRSGFDAARWVGEAVALATSPVHQAERVALGHRACQEHYAAQRIAQAYERIYEDLLKVR